jgi:hypothetical protein
VDRGPNKRLANRAVVSREEPMSKTTCDNDHVDRRSADRLIACRQEPTSGGPCAEQLEVLRHDALDAAIGSNSTRLHSKGPATRVHRQTGEGLLLRTKCREGIGVDVRRLMIARVGHGYCGESVCVLRRDGAENDRAQEAEDCGVRSNRQRQRQNRDGG